MNQKHVLIIFVLLVLIGIGAVGFNAIHETVNKSLQAKTTAQITPTPVPVPEEVIFMNQQDIKQYSQFPGELSSVDLKNKEAVIETNKGLIKLEIYPEATKAASNFIFLAKDNFYDGLTFHRVIPEFVIQGGDPTGKGDGGPGYTFKEDKVVGKYDRGIVAMAKKPDEPAGTGGSQFFIMLADNPLPLDYVIFGKVISGMEVVDQIKVGDVMNKVYIKENIKAGP